MQLSSLNLCQQYVNNQNFVSSSENSNKSIIISVVTTVAIIVALSVSCFLYCKYLRNKNEERMNAAGQNSNSCFILVRVVDVGMMN